MNNSLYGGRGGFSPRPGNIIDAAHNRAAKRLPLYEHGISFQMMERITGREYVSLWSEGWEGNTASLKEFMGRYVEFYRLMGYDFANFDMNIGSYMPGSGALLGEKEGVIKNRGDFERYPWHQIPAIFKEKTYRIFEAFTEALPGDMCAVGGPGNGIFECVQDVVGYEYLCYIKADDPELFADLFKAVAQTNHTIWKEFLERFGKYYGVCRFGDDLGYKTSPLLPPGDIRTHVIPGYRRISDLIHSYGKPFLLHSCGNIFPVMDDIIEGAQINAKHSNEDVIAPFTVWVDRYGDRIGNFGGADVDVICQQDERTIKAYVREILDHCEGRGGIAFGTGNSVPDYVPASGYIAMVEAVREYRGDE